MSIVENGVEEGLDPNDIIKCMDYWKCTFKSDRLHKKSDVFKYDTM